VLTIRRHLAVVGLVAIVCFASGCAPPPQRPPVTYSNYSSSGGRCDVCGVVNDVRQIAVKKGVSPGGMVIGAVAGGLLGSTIGGGSGRTAATVVGAVAGGAVGNEVGKNNGSPDVNWQITIRLDDGRDATVTQASDPQVRPGDYVEIRDNQVYRR
jgi:outer membrane lipoprotein SlyB